MAAICSKQKPKKVIIETPLLLFSLKILYACGKKSIAFTNRLKANTTSTIFNNIKILPWRKDKIPNNYLKISSMLAA